MRDEEEKEWKDRMAKKARGVQEEVKGVTEQVAEKTKEYKDKLVGK